MGSESGLLRKSETEGMEGFFNASYLLHPGVYVLRWQGRVMYVGQSIEVFSRLGQHSRRIMYDEVFFVRCEKGELNSIEQELIDKLKPELNLLRVKPHVAPQGLNSWSETQPRFGLKAGLSLAVSQVKIGSVVLNLPKAVAKRTPKSRPKRKAPIEVMSIASFGKIERRV